MHRSEHKSEIFNIDLQYDAQICVSQKKMRRSENGQKSLHRSVILPLIFDVFIYKKLNS